ncbi:MAG TPA: ACP S-malonyltransferase [Anaerolineae bacterium]|nr:ACP S-malonyltransferase [Anaerolineae bacterium]
MPDRLALVFPGQGSQYVGMGLDLCAQYSEARSVFDEADTALGFELSKLCFEGPEEDLNDTINTQPALLTVCVATLRTMGNLDEVGVISSVAGHSLGEYTALVAAGKVSFGDALRLVRERGRLMKEAGEQRPGGMAAVLGLPLESVAEACAVARQETATIVQVANINSPGQIVISGERRGLDRAIELAQHQGARRVVPLAVSIASHSVLMESASAGLREALNGIEFRETDTPVVGNVNGKPLLDSNAIREELTKQVVSPVQWVASVLWMLEHGAKTCVEIGPKDTLSKLIKHINSNVNRVCIGDVSAVRTWRSGAVHHWPLAGEA